MNSRQLGTVLAALRYWQHDLSRSVGAALEEIATDGGTLEPLTADEIDALCEQINGGEPNHVTIVLEGGVIQNVTADDPDALQIVLVDYDASDAGDDRMVMVPQHNDVPVGAWVQELEIEKSDDKEPTFDTLFNLIS